jgi:TonB-dependent receptor
MATQRHFNTNLFACSSTAVLALVLATPSAAQETTQSPGAAVAQQAAASADAQSGLSGQTSAAPSTPESGSDIVVTGRRAAIENATERKRQSDTVIDSVVADEAGKLPDTSLTEVLQRVSGVTITRFASLGSPDQFSFEGTGVQIRGLSGITGLLNGREIFSANGGSGLNWGDVTPELMSAVDVYKASTADLIEGGIGGAIDLRTRMPFDYHKLEVDATVGGSYGDFSRKVSPSASILLTDRWNTPLGQFGALVDLSYTRFRYADSFIRSEPYYQTTYNNKQVFVPGGFDYGNDLFDRKRRGLYTAFQWKPTDNLTIYQIDFVSNYKQKVGGGGVFAVDDESDTVLSGEFDNANIFQRGVVQGRNGAFYPGNSNNSTPSNTTTADFTQGFEWDPSSGVALRGALQFVHSTAKADDYGLGVGSAGVPQEALDFTGDLPDVGFNGTGAAITDPAQAAINDVVWNHQRNRANMTAANLDASFDLGDGFFKKVKVGARYANRRETDSFVGTWWSATGRGWNGVPQSYVATSPADDFMLYDFPDFFKGRLDVPSSYLMASPSILQESALQHVLQTYTQCSPSGSGATYCDPAVSLYSDENFGNAPSITRTQVRTIDAYYELTFGSQGALPFTGNIGVRLVNDRVSSSGVFTFNGGSTYYMTAADAAASYAEVGGAAGLAAWQAAHPGQKLPLTYTTVQSTGPRTESAEYTHLLPSMNINFHPTRTVIVRFAANQTISPPGFNDIRASGNSSVVTVASPYGQNFPGIFQGYSYGAGNPTLKPAISTNEDFSVEWYPSKSTTAHIDLFNKSIKNMLIYNDIKLDSASFFGGVSPISTSTDTGASVVNPGPVNGAANLNADKRSRVRGVEVGLRTYFDMLPGALRGFGVEGNFTYIDSKAPSSKALDMQGNPLSGLPIVGLSRYNVNAALLYDLGHWDARLAYSWRSRYLATTTGNGTTGNYAINGVNGVQYSLPVYAAGMGTLDASLSYKFNDHFSLSVDGSNLLDNISRTTMEILPGVVVTRSWFLNDRRVAATAHIHF